MAADVKSFKDEMRSFVDDQRKSGYYVLVSVLFALIVGQLGVWFYRLLEKVSVLKAGDVLEQFFLILVFFYVTVILWTYFSRVLVYYYESPSGEFLTFVLGFVVLMVISGVSLFPNLWCVGIAICLIFLAAKHRQVFTDLRNHYRNGERHQEDPVFIGRYSSYIGRAVTSICVSLFIAPVNSVLRRLGWHTINVNSYQRQGWQVNPLVDSSATWSWVSLIYAALFFLLGIVVSEPGKALINRVNGLGASPTSYLPRMLGDTVIFSVAHAMDLGGLLIYLLVLGFLIWVLARLIRSANIHVVTEIVARLWCYADFHFDTVGLVFYHQEMEAITKRMETIRDHPV